MSVLEQIAISGFCLINTTILLVAYKKVKAKKSFTVVPLFFPFGIFVWADAIVISSFWIVSSIFTLFVNDWYLFLLIASIFWFIRSLWDALYWIQEQFANTKRNNPKYLIGFSFFQGESVFIIYQVFWQCLSVIFAISSIYLTFLWLSNMVK